jgi:hypothetical protein
MTQERFLKLLDNPDLLASISYEELKTLALMYPYAHNLRYLLAIKSDQDNHPDFTRNLAAAAAHSLDRTRLFALIAPKKIVPQLQQDELVLELKPIETVQRELEAKAPPVVRQKEQGAPADAANSVEFKNEIPAPEPEPALILSGWTPEKKPEPTRDAVRHPERALPEPGKKPGLVPAPSFSVWISQFNPPALVPLPVQPEKPAAPVETSGNDAADHAAGLAAEQLVAPPRPDPTNARRKKCDGKQVHYFGNTGPVIPPARAPGKGNGDV